MGFFSDDMLPMLGVYEAETSELIATLDEIIARSEGQERFSEEDIAELFRCMHTIKGSSAMMGLDTLSQLAHKVEDLFDLLRGNPELSNSRVPDILDHLYAFGDYTKDELARMGDADYEPEDASAIIDGITSEIAAISGGTGKGPTVDEGRGEVKPDERDSTDSNTDTNDGESGGVRDDDFDEDGSILKVSFDQNEAMISARALVLVRQLGNKVPVKSHVPDDLTDLGASTAIAENGLLIVVEPSDVEEAKRFLAKNSFVRRITVLDEAEASPKPTADGDGKPAETTVVSERFVKLKWNNVHNLQNMAGEFLLQASRLRAISAEMPDNVRLRDTALQTARLVDDLVYCINNMAMVSMSVMVPQLSRMVRDMCRSSGKQVTFNVLGGDIEIDRNLYNSISEPLLHIIRNAVDHGIEMPEDRLAAGKEARGSVTLSIENLGARVAFRVSDDGRGIDADSVIAKAEAAGKLEKPADQYSRSEILKMVMLPGLSTSNSVSEYSGRGVGMDVVNTVVRDFNGHVDIESNPGQGTSITLFMPLSVASVESLGFRIGPSAYHMPLFNLVMIIVAEEAKEQLSRFEGSSMLLYEKRYIPVLDMHDILGCQGENEFYIVCHSMSEEFVIGVDDIIGEFECANRPLPRCLGSDWQRLCPIRNVAILEDGMVSYALHAAILSTIAQGRGSQLDGQLMDVDAAETKLTSDEDDSSEYSAIPAQAFVFTLGDDLFGISIDSVERVMAMPDYAETPRPIPSLLGLANFRNKALPVFDLAQFAGANEPSTYALILVDKNGNRSGVTISDAMGVRELDDAVLTDEQPDYREFPAGLRLVSSVRTDPKGKPINILAMRS